MTLTRPEQTDHPSLSPDKKKSNRTLRPPSPPAVARPGPGRPGLSRDLNLRRDTTAWPGVDRWKTRMGGWRVACIWIAGATKRGGAGSGGRGQRSTPCIPGSRTDRSLTDEQTKGTGRVRWGAGRSDRCCPPPDYRCTMQTHLGSHVPHTRASAHMNEHTEDICINISSGLNSNANMRNQHRELKGLIAPYSLQNHASPS